MAKKQKSKKRLDKYYYLAKDHGFRSRATFKLIQLNKKYNFFSDATVCVDLCAAPGGWLQAATKFMPVSSLKVGVDLDPIKPIPGCTTIVSDITTQDCRNKLDKELKHMKADIFLNDGAPNVGGNWEMDAFTQSELVLYAVKLASEFLKVGGWFVTKVFRSSDYSSLIYVMNQLFRKVEATKPLASRQVSAEIFVVCSGFKGGDIDAKLLDPKFALKQLDDEEDTKMNSIKSIKALLEASSSRHRSGYYSNSLFTKKEFSEFIESPSPYQFLYEVNKVTADTDKSKRYIELVKQPNGYQDIFNDLKVLGKGELQTLIHWRDKIRVRNSKLKKEANKDSKEVVEISEDAYKEKKLKEMEEEIKKVAKAKKKKLEVAEKKKEKNELRQKISFLKENNYFETKDEYDGEFFKYLQDNNINMEDLEYKNDDDLSDSDDEENKKVEGVEEIELSDLDEEDYYNMMNDYIESNEKLHQEEKDDLAAKKYEQKKNKELKKSKRREKLEDNVSDIDDDEIKVEKDEDKEEVDDEEKKREDGSDVYVGSEDDSDDLNDEDEDFIEKLISTKREEKKALKEKNSNVELKLKEEDASKTKEKVIIKEKKEKKENKTKKEIKNKDDLFVNPLKKVKINKKEASDVKEDTKTIKTEKSKNKLEEDDEDNSNLSYDTDEEEVKKNKKLLSKKRKKEIEDKNKSLDNKEIEYVSKEHVYDNDSDMDIDEIAEIRALAKKMLRKKDRLAIFDSSYNRYAFDDFDEAPEWFRDDEKLHYKPATPITKEEVNAEREYLREINARTPKKIQEAKNRKKKKLAKQMEKVKKQAQVISNQEEMGEGSKLRQIEKLYRKELTKNKPQKKYFAVRAGQKVGRNTRNVKFVDKRLKKDKRAMKRVERRDKKKGKGDKNAQKVQKLSKQKKGIKNRRK